MNKTSPAHRAERSSKYRNKIVDSRGLRASAALTLVAAATFTALGVSTAPPASAAPAAQCIDTLYLTDTTSDDVKATTIAGAVSAGKFYDATPGTSGTPNQLGISKDGIAGYSTTNSGTSSIAKYIAADGTGTNPQPTTVAKPTVAGVGNVAGAFNPKNQQFYYGGYNAAGNLVISVYDPVSNNVISPLVTVTAPSAPGTNGDLAFSPGGRLYFVASSATSSSLYDLEAALPTAQSNTVLTARRLTTTAVPAATNGIAFASDGYLYLGRATQLTKVNPITGAPAPSAINLTAGINSTDLGSCANPTSAELAVNVPERVNPTDQFTIGLGGGSYTDPNAVPFGTGTTTGTDVGPQTAVGETAGPGILIPGETYTTTITPAGTTNANNYNFSYSCTDQDGAVVKSGSGTSTTLTPTAGTGATIDCKFTAAPKTGISFTKDVSPATFTQAGQTLTYSFSATNDGVTPLSNFTVVDNKPGLSPVICLPTAQGGTLAVGATTNCSASYTVTAADVQSGTVANSAIASGTTPGGLVISASSSTFSGNFATGLVATDDTATTTFNEPVTLGGSSNDTAGTSTINVASTIFPQTGQPAGANVSGDGKTLIIEGQGVWTINNDGSITFAPAAIFDGTSGPVLYTASDNNGFTATGRATVTVAKGPSSTNDAITGVIQGGTGTVNPLSNDTPSQNADGSAGSFDNSTFEFTLANLPAGSTLSNGNQTVTVAGEGTYAFNPATAVVTFTGLNSFSGPSTPVTYTVQDQLANVNTGLISVQVSAVNPNAVDDEVKTSVNQSVNANVLSNDLRGDPDVPFVAASVVFNSNDAKTATIANEGTYTVQANGSITFAPVANYTGTSSIVYRVADANGTTTTATLTVFIGQGAIASNDSISIPQAQTRDIPILNNDRAGDQGIPCTAFNTPVNCNTGTFVNSTFSFPATGQPADAEISNGGQQILLPSIGTFSYNTSNQTVTFDPTNRFTGPTPAVTYQISDSYGNQVNAEIIVDVRAVAPTATADSANTTFDTNVTVAGATNDIAGVDDNGTPNNAADDVTAPIVAAETYFSGGGQPNGATLSNNNKTIDVPTQGVWTILANGSIEFNPDSSFSGPTSAVTYRIEDSFGNQTTATATVNVRPGAQGVNDSGTTDQNVTISGSVVANDVASQLANGDAGSFDTTTLIFPATGQPAGSVIAANGKTITVPNEGVYTVLANGVVSFNPDAQFSGPASPVVYSVEDSLGNVASAAINVNVVSLAPTATDDEGFTPFNTPFTFPGATNDVGASSTATIDAGLTIFPTSGQSTNAVITGGGKVLTILGQGVWEIQTNGSVIFTPAAGFEGPADEVVYQIEDVNGTIARAELNVTVRQGPDTTADTPTTDQNVTVSFPVLNNDTPGELVDGTNGSFIGSSLVFTTDNQPANATVAIGGLSITVANEGTYTIDQSTGEVSFDPEAQFTGNTSAVTYSVTDSLGNSTTGTITVAVDALKPTATDDSATTAFNTAVTLEGATNDTAAGATAPIVAANTTFPATGQPTNSVLSQDAKTLTVPNQGVWEVQANGSVVFTPVAGYTGNAQAVYEILDANGTPDQGLLSVTVRSGPVAQNDTDATPQNVDIDVNVLLNDTPGDKADGTAGSFNNASLVFPASGQPAGAVVSNGGKTLTVADEGVYTANANGTVGFNPDADFTGPAQAITYSITDSESNTVSATLAITVAGVDPVATDDAATTAAGTPVTLPGATNDSEGSTNAPLVIANTVFPNTGQPLGSTLSNNGKTLTVANEGVWEIQANGSVIFTPAGNFVGNTTTVVYQIEDSNGTTARANLNVTVGSGPIANPDRDNTAQNVPVTFSLLANDVPGENGTFDAASVVFINAPASATVSADRKTITIAGEGTYVINNGVLTFTPVASFTGVGTRLFYEVTDSFGNKANSDIFVIVNGVEPVAQNDSGETPFNTSITLNVLKNDSAGTGTTLVPGSLKLVNSTNGNLVDELSIEGEGVWKVVNGELTFTPVKGFTGKTTAVTYEVKDSNGTPARAKAEVTVLGIGSVEPSDAKTVEGVSITVDVLDNAVAAPGEEIVKGSLCILPSTLIVDGKKIKIAGDDCVDKFTQPGVGSWVVKNDGTVKFTPAEGFVGTTMIDFQVKDTGDNVYSDTLTIEVTTDDQATNPDDNNNNPDDNNTDNNTDNNSPDDNDNDGLPNTGGPALILVLLSAGLLGFGGFLVRRSRLRK